MFYAYEKIELEYKPYESLNLFTISGIPLFFGLGVFDLEGNAVIMNIHASMKKLKCLIRLCTL